MIDINFNEDIKFKNYNLEIIKKKGKVKKIIVKDGIIKIKFNPNKLMCTMCNSKYCNHIYFILYEYYYIPYNLLPSIKISNFNYNYDTFIEDFNNYFKNYECCICLSNKFKDYNICKSCYQVIHTKCLNKWKCKCQLCPLCKN